MTLRIRNRWWQPLARSVASTRFGTALNRHVMPKVDRVVMRLSGGRTTASSLITGLPVILLTTTGAKSGKQRTAPLVAIPDGRKLALIASNWGQKRNPAWYYNLRANPQAIVDAAGEKRSYTARAATAKEYDKYWRWAVRLYPGYENYKQRSGGRDIPIMVLSPAEAASEEK